MCVINPIRKLSLEIPNWNVSNCLESNLFRSVAQTSEDPFESSLGDPSYSHTIGDALPLGAGHGNELTGLIKREQREQNAYGRFDETSSGSSAE